MQITRPEFLFYLFNTSLNITDHLLLVVGEVAVCRALIYNVVGPQSNLTLLVEVENPNLIITDIEIVHVGYAIYYMYIADFMKY